MTDAILGLTPPAYSIANNPIVVKPSQQFTVYLVLSLNDFSSVGHEVSIGFTPEHLVAIDAIERGAPPFEMNLSPGFRSLDNEHGVIEQFEAASLYDVLPPGSTFVVAEVMFEARRHGPAEIMPFFHPGAAVIDEGGAIEGVAFQGARLMVSSGERRRRGR